MAIMSFWTARDLVYVFLRFETSRIGWKSFKSRWQKASFLAGGGGDSAHTPTFNYSQSFAMRLNKIKEYFRQVTRDSSFCRLCRQFRDSLNRAARFLPVSLDYAISQLYHVQKTFSHPIIAVKWCWSRLVFGWVTGWEHHRSSSRKAQAESKLDQASDAADWQQKQCFKIKISNFLRLKDF